MKLEDLVPLPQAILMRIGAGLAATAIVAAAIGGVWLSGRHAGVAVERPKTDAAVDHADAAGLELKGAQESAVRTDAYQHLDLTVHQAAAAATAAAGAAADATEPLDPARAERLRAFDERLCGLRPALCPAAGAAAQGGDAPGGANPLQPGADAGEADRR